MATINIKQMLESTKSEHDRIVNQYKQGNDYYFNNADIINTGAAAIAEVNEYLGQLGKNPLKSANNKIPTNWHRILTDQKIGYLFTYPPQFDIDGVDELAKKISECLGDRYEKVIKQIATDSSNSGIGWMAYWYEFGLNADNDFNYYFVNPTQIRAVYDNKSIIPKISSIIYSYITKVEDKPSINYELWTDKDVTYFKQSENAQPVQLETKNHSYGEIPFIPFKNNDKCVSDLKMYKSLIDAIDKLISGFANDIDDIQEIIWVIKNYAGDTNKYDYNDETGEQVERTIDLLQEIKAKKLLTVDDNGGVDTLRGEIPYEARSKFLDILVNQLFVSAMAVNPNPDKVGQASGVYIKFLYSLLELKAGLMETEFRPSLNQFVRAILHYLSAEPKVKIEQKWTRNRPTNDIEIVNMIAQTSPTILSDETKTKEHPLTENWQTEREHIQEEQSQLVDNIFNGGG